MKTITAVVGIICCLALGSAVAAGPEWCGAGNYSASHPLAWERFEDAATALVEEDRIREAYALVVDALDTEMMSFPQRPEAAIVKEALNQYLEYILEPGREAPAIFKPGPPNPLMTPPALQYELGPLGEGAPTAFKLEIPCPALVPGNDPALRDIAHALWSMHKVATVRDFSSALDIAALRSTKLYKDYENYTMKGLPMWPWEMWLNGFLVPDDFNAPAPKRQWVFFRPNLSPALVTGSAEDTGLDFGLTLEVGHVWYRKKDYSSWWGLSVMAAVTDDEGAGYGGLLRWDDYTLGVAHHDRNDETLVYVSVDLYKLVTGEKSRVNSAQGFLDALIRKAKTNIETGIQ